MKKLFIIANWKSNKTETEAKQWFAEFSIFNFQFSNEEKEIILCPSFTLLSGIKSLIISNKLSIKLGAQNVSSFENGAYTGEVNSEQIKDFVDYVIIGHSERRENFLETDEIISRKVEMAKKHNLIPIFCVQAEKTNIPEGVKIVAYEPVFAIGTGNPDTPGNADKIAAKIKEKNKIDYVLYGGSVNATNVHSFTQMPNINGVLVGGSSLDPKEFLEIIKNA